MDFKCQNEALSGLTDLAINRRHSVMIEGVKGSGKTHLAHEYSKLLNISDFQVIEPTVNAIRDTIESLYSIENDAVICIENLDTGVNGASYALLKFLEEPIPNAYIVVTVRNMKRIPDTIVSRSAVVTTSPPIDSDIVTYAKDKDARQFELKSKLPIWKCVRSFGDVDTVLNMSAEHLKYFIDLEGKLNFSDSISQLMWDLGHYPDNTDTPVELVLRYIMNLCNSPHITKSAVNCLNDLSLGRIASHAVIARFCFDAKFCE